MVATEQKDEAGSSGKPTKMGGLKKLLFTCSAEEVVEARFAAIGGVPVNDAAFCCLIDGRNQRGQFGRISFAAGSDSLLQSSQSRHDAPIAE